MGPAFQVRIHPMAMRLASVRATELQSLEHAKTNPILRKAFSEVIASEPIRPILGGLHEL